MIKHNFPKLENPNAIRKFTKYTLQNFLKIYDIRYSL